MRSDATKGAVEQRGSPRSFGEWAVLALYAWWLFYMGTFVVADVSFWWIEHVYRPPSEWICLALMLPPYLWLVSLAFRLCSFRVIRSRERPPYALSTLDRFATALMGAPLVYFVFEAYGRIGYTYFLGVEWLPPNVFAPLQTAAVLAAVKCHWLALPE